MEKPDVNLPTIFQQFTQKLSLSYNKSRPNSNHGSFENFQLLTAETNCHDSSDLRKISKSSSNIHLSSKENAISFKSYDDKGPKTVTTENGQVKLVSPYGDWCAFRFNNH
jgi:hypothetical protein